MPRLTQAIAFIHLGRPLFLAGGFILHALGISLALYWGVSFHLGAALWGQVVITAAQLMTHYANEYFDLDADRANPHRTRWAGGSGVLVAGLVPPWMALAAARLLAITALAGMAVLVFVIKTGPLTAPLVLLAMGLAWFYSAPPLRLHSTGWGELTTAALVPMLTPLLGFYLQAGALAALPFLATFPLAAFQFAMLLVIEFPDAIGDRAGHKRTLVVRLGESAAARLHNAVLLAAYALLPGLVLLGLPSLAALAVAGSFPLAAWQLWRMGRGAWSRPDAWESLAFASIALLMSAAASLTVLFMGLA